MKTKKTEIDIDFIGGMGPLTENEEKALCKFFKKNSLPAKRIVRKTLTKKKKEHSEK